MVNLLDSGLFGGIGHLCVKKKTTTTKVALIRARRRSRPGFGRLGGNLLKMSLALVSADSRGSLMP